MFKEKKCSPFVNVCYTEMVKKNFCIPLLEGIFLKKQRDILQATSNWDKNVYLVILKGYLDIIYEVHSPHKK